MQKYELSHLNSMAITDAHLDSLVIEIASLLPRCGEKTVNGRLRSCGICVPRQKIRASLRRVDPPVYMKDVEVSYIQEGIK